MHGPWEGVRIMMLGGYTDNRGRVVTSLVVCIGNYVSSECGQLTVHHRHALYGDYRVLEGCRVACESQVSVCGVDGRWGS